MQAIKRLIFFVCVIKLTLAINPHEIFSNRQELHQYGQLQPVPDPTLTPPFQEQPVPDFQPPVNQPPGVDGAAQTAAQLAAQQAAAQQAAVQQAAAQQAQAAADAAAQQATADAALQQATFQCDQTIMGRDFEYNSALNLIQNEDYLDDADIDELRFFKRKRRDTKAEEEVKKETDETFIGQFGDIPDEKLNRDKRYSLSAANDRVIRADRVKRATCTVPIQYEVAVSQTFTCPTKRCSCPGDTESTESATTTPLHSPEHFAAGVGAATLLTLAMNPPPTNVPGNAPQPGSPGGGGLPSANPGNLALALIPAGLTAIAVFPPFATPRTPGIDTEAAIFKEAAVSAIARRRSYRQPSLKDRFLKNVRCLIPRLKAKFGRKSNSVSDYGYGKKKRDTGFGYQHHQPRYGYHQRAGYGEPEECGTIEDCFDLPCPKFGFAVKLSFTRRGPPTRNNYDDIRRHFQSRQTGEGFTSAAPPDCRVISY